MPFCHTEVTAERFSVSEFGIGQCATTVMQCIRPFIALTIIYQDDASLASTKVFRGLETEAPEVPPTPDSASTPFRTVCLGAILDNPEVMPIRNVNECVQICWIACDMDRQNDSRLFGNRGFNFGNIQQKTIGSRIDKDRHGVRHQNSDDGCLEGIRCGNDFVAGTNASGFQCYIERGCAAIDTNAVLGTLEFGELLCKFWNLRATNPPLSTLVNTFKRFEIGRILCRPCRETSSSDRFAPVYCQCCHLFVPL